ncbi:MAG: hypothetical protein JW739_03345 [Opitutales bacterium]|nr:hypothetical protein [Opitutales bacterium]
MNIDPIKRQAQISSLRQVARKKGDSSVSGEDSLHLDSGFHENLMAQLNDMPDVRPDVVALGRRLASDPDYPSDGTLEQLAAILLDDSAEISREAEQAPR